MAELEDVHVVIPTGLLERNRGVETREGQLQDPPEKIISIPGLHLNRQKFGLDFGVRGGDQVGKNLHHGHRTLRVAFSTQARDKEPLKVGFETDCVKWHDREQIEGREILELIVELNSIVGLQQAKLWEYWKALF